MRHPRMIDAVTMLAVTTLATLATRCSIGVPTLCVPEEANVGFFSKGDCVLTNASSFRGHEWLTFLGNRDLPPSSRFSEGEIKTIIEGNRRVDWPKELLVHMANGILAYAAAATEFQDRPEKQPVHFLLSQTNDSPEAILEGDEVMRALTRKGVEAWASDRVLALTSFGAVCHTLQDSFSQAHTDREPAAARPWCIRRVKVYATRAPGKEVPIDQIHGGKTGDSIGHTTTLDSIYRIGRDCNDPERAEDVERCLAPEATRARLATRDFLGLALALVGRSASASDVDEAMNAFFEIHTPFCQ